MNDEASLANDSDKEQLGFSVLDIVKHAVKTIIRTLGDSDRLAVVSYSTLPKLVLPLTSMNAAGKKLAEEKVKTLKPEGQTNLWGGLVTGLDIIKDRKSSESISAIMLLTDGMPNIVPDGGHLANLRKYKSDHPSVDCLINTFGFGYTLDSKLLNDIAIEGNGAYGFIPDSSFVGTIFINSLSNLLSTYSSKATLTVTPKNNLAITEAPGVATAPASVEGVGAGPTDIELDLVFIVDCTGSMSSYITEAQANIKSIVDTIMTSERANVKFALVSYRDHPPQEDTYITKVFEFTGDMKEMKSAVDTMFAHGGGDSPEAVATGMRDACELKFREGSTKVAILVADAPPHGTVWCF